MNILEKSLASVQAEFEPIFWCHTDAETILKFAEESACGRLNFEYEIENIREFISNQAALAAVVAIMRIDFENNVEQAISESLEYRIPDHRQINVKITRDEALSYVGNTQIQIQNMTNGAGTIVDVFTMRQTLDQISGPEYLDVKPFVARRVTTSFDVREIQ